VGDQGVRVEGGGRGHLRRPTVNGKARVKRPDLPSPSAYGRLVLGALALAVAIAPPSGCGRDGRPPLFPATGRVLADGQPARGVEVRLHPFNRSRDFDAERPFATTGEDGSFRLGTREKEDGAPEGRYRVTLFWSDRPPGADPGDDLLGGRYT